jgi:hypothetical protein
MRSVILFLLIIGLSACETKEHATAELEALRKAQGAAAKATARANMTVEEEIGIPECDEYVRKYQACLAEKVPADAKTRLRAALDAQRKQWRGATSDPYKRAAVADQCRSAAAAAKQSLADFGCDF